MPVRNTKRGTPRRAQKGNRKSGRSGRRTPTRKPQRHVFDYAVNEAVVINSKKAQNQGFEPCKSNKVPLYTTGRCVSPSSQKFKEAHLDLDKVGNPMPDAYVWIENEGWVPNCSAQAKQMGVKCCKKPDMIPSPKTGFCIDIGGPSYNRLNIQQQDNPNNARQQLFGTASADWNNTPILQSYDTYWPPNTYLLKPGFAPESSSARLERSTPAFRQYVAGLNAQGGLDVNDIPPPIPPRPMWAQQVMQTTQQQPQMQPQQQLQMQIQPQQQLQIQPQPQMQQPRPSSVPRVAPTAAPALAPPALAPQVPPALAAQVPPAAIPGSARRSPPAQTPPRPNSAPWFPPHSPPGSNPRFQPPSPPGSARQSSPAARPLSTRPGSNVSSINNGGEYVNVKNGEEVLEEVLEQLVQSAVSAAYMSIEAAADANRARLTASVGDSLRGANNSPAQTKAERKAMQASEVARDVMQQILNDVQQVIGKGGINSESEASLVNDINVIARTMELGAEIDNEVKRPETAGSLQSVQNLIQAASELQALGNLPTSPEVQAVVDLANVVAGEMVGPINEANAIDVAGVMDQGDWLFGDAVTSPLTQVFVPNAQNCNGLAPYNDQIPLNDQDCIQKGCNFARDTLTCTNDVGNESPWNRFVNTWAANKQDDRKYVIGTTHKVPFLRTGKVNALKIKNTGHTGHPQRVSHTDESDQANLRRHLAYLRAVGELPGHCADLPEKYDTRDENLQACRVAGCVFDGQGKCISDAAMQPEQRNAEQDEPPAVLMAQEDMAQEDQMPALTIAEQQAEFRKMSAQAGALIESLRFTGKVSDDDLRRLDQLYTNAIRLLNEFPNQIISARVGMETVMIEANRILATLPNRRSGRRG